jgi:large subunit ribosomal protein L22
MEYTHVQKNIDSTPRKLRLVAGMVRGTPHEQAVDILKFTSKAAALPLAKAIQTAVANTGSKTGLFFKKIEINEGIKMRRYRVGTAGRGRGRPYKLRFSHIKVVLTDEPVMLKSQKSKLKTKKLEVKSAEENMNAEVKTEKGGKKINQDTK